MRITRAAAWLLPAIVIVLLIAGLILAALLDARLDGHAAAFAAHQSEVLELTRAWSAGGVEEMRRALDLQDTVLAMLPAHADLADLRQAVTGNWWLGLLAALVLGGLAVWLADRARAPDASPTPNPAVRRVRTSAALLPTIIALLLAFGLYAAAGINNRLGTYVAALGDHQRRLADLAAQWPREEAAALAAPIGSAGAATADMLALRGTIGGNWFVAFIAALVLIVFAIWLMLRGQPATPIDEEEL